MQVGLSLLNSTECTDRLLGEFPVFDQGQNICAAGEGRLFLFEKRRVGWNSCWGSSTSFDEGQNICAAGERCVWRVCGMCAGASSA